MPRAGDIRPKVTHEPSAWLRQAVAARLRQVQAQGLDPHGGDPMIVAPIGRSAAPGSREDRECDRCRAYSPEGDPFYPFSLRAARGLVLVGGLCQACCDREVAR